MSSINSISGYSSTTYGLSSLLDALSKNAKSSDSSSESDDLFELLKANSGIRDYNVLKDGGGNAFIPTIEQMNNATTPSTKLGFASAFSSAVLMQSDACSKTGIATRVSDITDQAKAALEAVQDAIDTVTNKTAGDNDATRKKLESYQETISATLDNINTAMKQITNLLPKVSDSEKEALVATFKEMDVLGATIARESGAKWTSFTGNSDNTVKGYSAAEASSSTSSSTDFNGLSSFLDIMA